MNKIITLKEYEDWLVKCSDKHIIEDDIVTFKNQIEKINLLIKRAERELGDKQ